MTGHADHQLDNDKIAQQLNMKSTARPQQVGPALLILVVTEFLTPNPGS